MLRGMATPGIPIIAVCNQKGGVGKSTVTVCLASALSRTYEKRVLVVDLDPQCNATLFLGVQAPPTPEGGFTTAAVLEGGEGGALDERSIWDTAFGPTVKAIPAELRKLARFNTNIESDAPFRLRQALTHPDLAKRFDVVLIDTPPDTGRLTQNALVAATDVLIVAEPSYLSNDGTEEVTETIATAQKHYNPHLNALGIVVNKMERGKKEPTFRLGELAAMYGEDVLVEMLIPYSDPLKAITADHVPLHDDRPPSRLLKVREPFDAIAGYALGLHGRDMVDVHRRLEELKKPYVEGTAQPDGGDDGDEALAEVISL